MDITLLRFFNGYHSQAMDMVMTIATNGLTWIPLYIGLVVIVCVWRPRRDALRIILCALICVAVTACVDELMVKPWVCRLRPTHDPAVMHTINIVGGLRGSGYSFFSAHAANTFGIALFMSLAMRRRWLTVVLVAWSLLNCYSRLYLGVHYPSDVLVGILFGAAVAFLIYRYIYDEDTRLRL